MGVVCQSVRGCGTRYCWAIKHTLPCLLYVHKVVWAHQKGVFAAVQHPLTVLDERLSTYWVFSPLTWLHISASFGSVLSVCVCVCDNER